MIQVVCSFLLTFECSTRAILPWHAKAEHEPEPFNLEANVTLSSGAEGTAGCAWLLPQPGKISISKSTMLPFRRIRIEMAWRISIGENSS